MSTHLAIATTAKGVLEQVQLPTPTPGPGEVLIKVHYTALIPFDTYQLDMAYKLTDAYPYVLGFAGAGEVTSVGEGVTDLKEGDRVSSFNYPLSKNKALQEYTLVPRTLVAKVPDSFPLHAAASMPDNFTTAMFAIFGRPNLALPVPSSFPAPSAPPNADAPILVYGAGSSSGQYMVQMFRLAGYTKILATASPHNHAYLRELGAAQCFDYRAPALVQDILQATGGAKVVMAVDCIAARPSLQAISGVVGTGSRVALLMPVKDGETVTNDVNSEMHFGVPPWAESLFSGVEMLQVYTFRNQEDAFARDSIMPKILPQLLESGIIRANPIRLLKEGPLKERVEIGLDLLRNNKISREKTYISIHDELILFMSPTTILQPRSIATRILVPASSSLRRAMSGTNAPNASGMSPHDSKALKEREANDSEEKILAAMKELYSCKPQESSYGVYAKDAVFQDPIGIAEGVHSIKAQFNGLAKLFPRADIAKFRVLETPGGAPLGTIFIDQDVAYYRDPKTTSPTKTLNSLLTLHTNAQNQITRHVEEWDHKRDASKEDGFFGMLNDQRKRVTASLVDKLVSSDPPTKE